VKGIEMNERVALVLGGTRGIGRALTKAIVEHWSGDGHVYFTARNREDCARIVAEFRDEQKTVGALPFDLADPKSPASLAREIEMRHGKLDVLVQNGAYMPRAGAPSVEDARPMIAANSHGTLRVLSAFLPILRENGRMIIVASRLGVLANLPEHLRDRFDPSMNDPSAINEAIDEYVSAVESGTAEREGWPSWVNIPSKVAQVAVTLSFARWAKENGNLPSGALINAACPGLTLTDATREFMGTVFQADEAQTPEEAAEALVRLAMLPAGESEPYGRLVRHGMIVPFADAATV
jgi:carbonyl reductase 1